MERRQSFTASMVIKNVHEDCTEKETVIARIDKKVFDYYFRKCLTGDRGPRQAFICYFYQQFYEACVAEGIKAEWDERNAEKIWVVLSRLNFHPPQVTGVGTMKSKSKRGKGIE